jgi:hypothetical protein
MKMEKLRGFGLRTPINFIGGHEIYGIGYVIIIQQVINYLAGKLEIDISSVSR